MAFLTKREHADDGSRTPAEILDETFDLHPKAREDVRSEKDAMLGDLLAPILGDLGGADHLTAAQQWEAVARRLRVNGLKVADRPPSRKEQAVATAVAQIERARMDLERWEKTPEDEF